MLVPRINVIPTIRRIANVTHSASVRIVRIRFLYCYALWPLVAFDMDITKSIVSERDRALIGGDYSNYHAQSTRRIHTLRKRLGVTTPRGRKYTPRSAVTAQDVAKNVESVPRQNVSSPRLLTFTDGCSYSLPAPKEPGQMQWL